MAAATDDVQIANMSLVHLAHTTFIESFDQQGKEAKLCKLFYNTAREATLEGADWSFARSRLALASHQEDPPEGVWAYRYQYPSDCVKFRYIVNPAGPKADPVPYEIERADNGTRSILTNMETATGVYTRNETSTSLFTNSFVVALSHRLAYDLAMPMARKRTDKQDQFNEFLAALRWAEVDNANERVRERPRDADWVEAR